MEVTRGQLIRKVAEKSEFYIKDVEVVFNALEEAIYDCFSELDDDNDVNNPISIRITPGLSISGYIVPSRERVDPRNRKSIVCRPCGKFSAKFSNGFRDRVNKTYEEKKA